MQMYICKDENNRIFPCCVWYENIEPDSGWILVNWDDEQDFYEEHGVPLYKYVNGQVVARTQQEVQADVDALPIPEPTPEEILRADVDYLLMMIDEG